MAKDSFGKKGLFIFGAGLLGGVILSQVFKTQISGIYDKIPILGQIKANHGYYQQY